MNDADGSLLIGYDASDPARTPAGGDPRKKSKRVALRLKR
jgi:hypothetical protein